MTSLIRSAVDGGVTFFDTAQVYGPFTNEEHVDRPPPHVHARVCKCPLDTGVQREKGRP